MGLVYKSAMFGACLLALTGCGQSGDSVKSDSPASNVSAPATDSGAHKPQAVAKQSRSVVTLETSMGPIMVELSPDKAPVTVENFLGYVERGYYDGLIFHRVIPGFMIQGGGMKEDMSSASTGEAIKNESSNGLSNGRGTIAMARTNDPDSATSQFFINQADNTFLDYQPGRPGYTVFGRVISGMDIVDKIANVKTGRQAGHSDVPEQAIVISKATITEKQANKR